MVGVFFYCYFLSMNTEKLYDKLVESEEIKDIPIDYIFRVVICVMQIINSGECFDKED